MGGAGGVGPCQHPRGVGLARTGPGVLGRHARPGDGRHRPGQLTQHPSHETTPSPSALTVRALFLGRPRRCGRGRPGEITRASRAPPVRLAPSRWVPPPIAVPILPGAGVAESATRTPGRMGTPASSFPCAVRSHGSLSTPQRPAEFAVLPHHGAPRPARRRLAHPAATVQPSGKLRRGYARPVQRVPPPIAQGDVAGHEQVVVVAQDIAVGGAAGVGGQTSKFGAVSSSRCAGDHSRRRPRLWRYFNQPQRREGMPQQLRRSGSGRPAMR